MTDHLLQEVDADMRAERMMQLWARYRRPLMFAVIAIVLGTAAHSIWQYYHEKQGGEMLTRLTTAQQLMVAGKNDEAAAAFGAVASDASGDQRTLAQIWQSRALVAADKKDEAATVLTTAADGKTGLWSDIACLRLASLKGGQAACLASTKDSPLMYQRHEWDAAGLWAAGKHDEAIAALEQLATSPDTSDAMRDRIGQWLATMRSEKPSA